MALVLAFVCVLPVGGPIAVPIVLYHVVKAYMAGQGRLATAALLITTVTVTISIRFFVNS